MGGSKHMAAQLRSLLARGGLHRMPCAFDAFSARLIERAGFDLTFMSGFGVSASRLAAPDAGVISFGEMVDQGRNICQAVDIPVIGDADTGFGNALSAQRTVRGYAQAGFAGLMVEDQVAPKRCGHVAGKAVVPRDEAVRRMAAVLEERERLRDAGHDLVVVARTDAYTPLGLDEAVWRANRFAEMGCEVLFIEAPRETEELAQIGARVTGGHLMANLVEHGDTPILPPAQLEELGFRVVAYPLTLLSSAGRAMEQALERLKTEEHPPDSSLLQFEQVKEIVRFPQYDADLARLEGAQPDVGKI